ncbi:MAG: amidohydrolase [Saprospiraceae bacterium]|jgi:amidohydrolase|nr:amidohydrolase [Saprospiraceae bacterium]
MQSKILFLLLFVTASLHAQKGPFSDGKEMADLIEKLAVKYENDVITWRRHLHQNPELSNREFKTMEYIAANLKAMDVRIETGMAHTGVVAVLETGRPGPVIGLRADMDALPVRERTNLPFASKVESEYLGQKVGVMHACGHDSHVAILMGTAKMLHDMKDKLNGKIVFVFQPAEEGAPDGEEGGAALMIKQGLIEKYGIQVMYGLHISSVTEVGKITYRPMGTMAAADQFKITVKGKQTHGSRPWSGVDPITVSAQIIMGLQTIVSRQLDLTDEAAVISIGKITSGVRNNIIPEEAEMIGTIRTLDTAMQRQVHERIRRTAVSIAESAGATADVMIKIGYPVTYNNPELTARMLPSLEKAAGEDNVRVIKAMTGAEDFSFYAQKVPGLFFFLGGMSKDVHPLDATQHHTPDFIIDESGFTLGMKALAQLVVDTK